MTKQKGERRAPATHSLRLLGLLGNKESFLAMNMWTYKQDEGIPLREGALFKKGHPPPLPQQNWEGPQCHPPCPQHSYKQAGSCREDPCTYAHVKNITLFKSQDSCLKRVQKNDQKKKEAREEGAWLQLKGQLAPPEAQLVGAGGWGKSSWNPLPADAPCGRCKSTEHFWAVK